MEFSPTRTYQTCDFCGEQNHSDDCFGHSKGMVVCRWCFPKVENELSCDECGFVFAAQGIALECPACGCPSISHEYAATDRLLKELQLEEWKKRNAEPLSTLALLLRFESNADLSHLSDLSYNTGSYEIKTL